MTNWGNFLEIWLDSFQNLTPYYPDNPWVDPYPNTLRIVTNGVTVATLDLNNALENNAGWFNCTASYVAATKQLSVTFKSDTLPQVSGSWTVDMAGVFGAANVTPGFGAWTGAWAEYHEVVQCGITGVSQPGPITAIAPSLSVGNWFVHEGANWGDPSWTLNGNAGWANDDALAPPKRLRLNWAVGGQLGHAWLNTYRLVPTQYMEIISRMQFSYPSGSGGDGLCLILQTAGTNVTDAFNKDSTAYGKFLTVKLDSYQNAGDPYVNTMYVFTNGVQLAAVDLPGAPLETNWWNNLKLRYYPATGATPRNLIVEFWTDGQSATVWQSADVDLGAHFGTETVTVGYEGLTGSAWENHDLMSTYVGGTVDVAGSYNGPKMTLNWPQQSYIGVDWQLEATPSLAAPNWQTLSVPWIRGGMNGGGTWNGTEIVTQVPATNPACFYRLVGH